MNAFRQLRELRCRDRRRLLPIRIVGGRDRILRQGMKDGLMPPKLVLEKLPGQCDGIIAANPFLLPTKKFPANFSDDEATIIIR